MLGGEGLRRKKRGLIYITFAMVFFLIGSYTYVMNYYKAEEETSAVFNDNKKNLDITYEDKYIRISSAAPKGNTGFIFYPGGKVEEEAYLNFMKKIAYNGYDVFLIKMPLRLAVLDQNRADEVIRDNPDITNWVMGGHSLGGTMAASYAENNEEINGLILYGAYPSKGTDLSKKDIKVLSIWGSNDEVVDIDKIKNSKKLLPDNSVIHELKGGNHSGFGNYGLQKGDGKATIDKNKQQDISVEYTISLIDSIEYNK